jgi:acyl-CoA reductase-like NAD-dependent aldehyde dehydrogenase
VNKCEVGMITRNRCRPIFDVSAPFYGWKDSSIGIPEHGRWDLDFFTKTKVVY